MSLSTPSLAPPAARLSCSAVFRRGSFDSVGSQEHVNLAHILSDLSVSSWSPATDDAVNALAYSAGTLYVGGVFQQGAVALEAVQQ